MVAQGLHQTSSQEAPAAPGKGTSLAAKEAKSKRPGHGRQRLPDTLERKRVVIDLEESQKQCAHCQTPLQKIGEDTSERLEFVPASLYVLEEVRPKYACPQGCAVQAAEKPAAPIEKGLAGPALLAQVVVSKYGDHLPLYRQEAIFQRLGVELSRQTMCGWMRSCAELVRPLWELMKDWTLQSQVLQTDDTPVAVQDDTRAHTRTGRIWTYVGDRDHPYVVYAFTGGRSRAGPEEFLQGYRGDVQADAFPGYDRMFKDRKEELTEHGCWAHVRRKFIEAQSADVCRASVMVAYIRLLYGVEREAKAQAMNPEQRRALRQAKSRSVLEDIHAYLVAQKPQVLPKSAIGEAMDYALSNWEALLRYCDHGHVEIDNNGAERSLRPIVVGRKNWLFYGSDRGGETGAILSTLIATCKRLHIEPFAYLRDLLARISSHPLQQLDDLLPDRWQLAQSAAKD